VGPPGVVWPPFGGSDGTLHDTAVDSHDTWRVPLDGGAPSRYLRGARQSSAAPDGASLACFVRGGIDLLPLPGGLAGPVLAVLVVAGRHAADVLLVQP
jgi:hypothetical protein